MTTEDQQFLTIQQLVMLAVEVGYPLDSEDEYLEALREMDSNGDGHVSCEEFEKWWRYRRERGQAV